MNNSIKLLLMGLASLTSGAIPLTYLLLARLDESYGQAPSRGRRGCLRKALLYQLIDLSLGL